MTALGSVDQAELHAYADGLLPPERAGAVERHLAAHPADMAAVSAWVAQNRALRDTYDATLNEPLPRRLAVAWLDRKMAVERMSRPSGLLAVAGVALLAGAALGSAGMWILAGASSRPSPALAAPAGPPGLVEEAVAAHTVFAADEARPVELGAGDAAELRAWFARRLGTQVAIPDLSGSGLSLLGGRLVSGPDGASAVILYQTQAGVRLSLVISRAQGQPDSGPAPRRSGALSTMWWISGQTGYAVTAALAEPVLRSAADQIRASQAVPSGGVQP